MYFAMDALSDDRGHWIDIEIERPTQSDLRRKAQICNLIGFRIGMVHTAGKHVQILTERFLAIEAIVIRSSQLLVKVWPCRQHGDILVRQGEYRFMAWHLVRDRNEAPINPIKALRSPHSKHLMLLGSGVADARLQALPSFGTTVCQLIDSHPGKVRAAEAFVMIDRRSEE